MDFATARRKMVDNQVRPNGVTDLRLIAALLEVPREHFVPPGKADLAYMDADLPVATIGIGGACRALLKPMVLARMIQALDLVETDRVLDLACGTGYATAVMARLADTVVGVEETPALAAEAERLLKQAGVSNATVASAPLTEGFAGMAPYDAILIGGAVEVVPPAVLGQLREGGRLVAIVGAGAMGKATLFRRTPHETSGIEVFDATAPALAGFRTPPAFVF